MTRLDGDPRVVPVYALTRGRTRSVGRDLPWESMITTTSVGVESLPKLRFEQAHIVGMCQRPLSVAEVAVELHLPLGVARILVSDLYADGMLVVHRPLLTRAGRPDSEILERLLAGLKARL
ncbi:MAG TPA: DUF742 domain-containing protein [Acidimicrobiales bacterium]|jgi:hypothetical protein